MQKEDGRSRFKYISNHSKSKYIRNSEKKPCHVGLTTEIKIITSNTPSVKDAAKTIRAQKDYKCKDKILRTSM